jgi:hypothetical protein
MDSDGGVGRRPGQSGQQLQLHEHRQSEGNAQPPDQRVRPARAALGQAGGRRGEQDDVRNAHCVAGGAEPGVLHGQHPRIDDRYGDHWHPAPRPTD